MKLPLSPESEPPWFRRLTRALLRLGERRGTAVLTLAVLLPALAIPQLLITLLGRGDRLVALASAALCTLLLAPPAAFIALRLASVLDRTRQLLTLFATHDDLTGIYNRRHFMSLVQREWERARRYTTPSALLLVDADHFRRINDQHGNAGGDELLRAIAKVVAESLRQADVLARFGGEQLIVFLPQTDPLGALDVAERVRERVQALAIEWQGKKIATTVSIGVAPMRNELPSLDWMIHEADTALYAAKADGRNCVRTLPFQASRSGGAFPINLG